jgi:hypothetical protein
VATLGQLPTMIERAALFKPVDPWLLWVLLGAVALGLPALLIAALRSAARARPREPAPPVRATAPERAEAAAPRD